MSVKLFSILKIAGIGCAALLLATTARAQRVNPNDPKNVQRGAELIKQAVQARGGERYLNFNNIMFNRHVHAVPERPVAKPDSIRSTG